MFKSEAMPDIPSTSVCLHSLGEYVTSPRIIVAIQYQCISESPDVSTLGQHVIPMHPGPLTVVQGAAITLLGSVSMTSDWTGIPCCIQMVSNDS